ncbi:Protein CBG08912 [Caenorhabditis briggsae]|uniref:Protein CBG08912 n=2 Tax=Caenorhabditis briggsae TaxID=6238 RepID=A8X7N8_CAEBR|nr:Protein CBG08912 [Caenorhabditis briggsae]ULT85237.1 hypothetical protein L3Y34_013780 [Caenorhabditis briggsae]CAP28649.2 Protein CBG08912 [Caenorhabditis briggsae]
MKRPLVSPDKDAILPFDDSLEAAMQQDGQQSPGYDFEPVDLNKKVHPAVLKLCTGEEYKVRGVFGVGGFSVVYRIRDQNGQQLAAKVISRRLYSTRYELATLRKIQENQHDNLLLLNSVGRLTNPPPGYTDEVIITEACGPSIRAVMTKARRETGNTKMCSFSMNNIKRIGKQVGDAMLHLEKLKIHHLDLKASNVAFTSNVKYEMDPNLTHPIITINDFEIKVIDYGTSLTHSKPGDPKPVKLVQPQNIRAPEVFMGLPYNEKSDVWSMGCLMAELYIVKLLFRPNHDAPTCEKDQSTFEHMVSRMNPTIPPEMIEESKQRGSCTINFEFLENRKEADNQYLLMKLMRDETDSPLFDLLKFILIFDPAERPSFAEVISHKFFAGI